MDMADGIAEAAIALKAGFLVLIPTDTVYGIAAAASAPDAIENLCRAKGRADDKPIAFLVTDEAEAKKRGACFSDAAHKLAMRFWPGPLTLVLPVGSGFEGFRVPNHPVTLALLKKAGGALYVTSANRSGQPAALTAKEAVEQLGSFAKMTLDAGPSPTAAPSTVVKVDGDNVTVLREGAVSAAEINNTCLSSFRN